MRPSWDTYFINMAKTVATRSTCDRAQVGAVLVRDRRIITTGFNGSPLGLEHCDDVGHLLVDNHCVRTTHAEANAIIQAALHGVSTNNAYCYVTHFPCFICCKLLINAGIKRVYFDNDYRVDNNAKQFFKQSNIEMWQKIGDEAYSIW